MDERNARYIADFGKPVANIMYINAPNIAIDKSADAAQGLEPMLQLSIGVRVMLRRNLWVAGGLVSGALGTVKVIVYAHGENSPVLPMYVLTEFEDFAGSYICDKLFPIKPAKAE